LILSISHMSLWSNDRIFCSEQSASATEICTLGDSGCCSAPRVYGKGDRRRQLGILCGDALVAMLGLLAQTPCAGMLAVHADMDDLDPRCSASGRKAGWCRAKHGSMGSQDGVVALGFRFLAQKRVTAKRGGANSRHRRSGQATKAPSSTAVGSRSHTRPQSPDAVDRPGVTINYYSDHDERSTRRSRTRCR
jgi:hypothetical protein